MNSLTQKRKRNSDQRRLIENFFSLSFLQVANYIMPLITLPYLVRVIGPEKYGLIMFAQAFIQYFVTLTDYGFNLTATRELSINRNNRPRVSEIFSAVMIVRILLMFAGLIILFGVIQLSTKFRADWLVYVFTFGLVMGNLFFPVWFFQGMEKMKYITVLNVLSKLIFTLSIFILIRKKSDYIYVPLLTSIGSLVAGVLALWIINRNFGIKFRFPKLESIKYQIKNGWHIFLSSISMNIYKTTDIFLLGIFANEVIVGYFSIAKKLIDATNQFAVIVSQTIYPHIAKTIVESFRDTIKFLKKVGIMISAFTLSGGILFFMLSKLITLFIAGEMINETAFSLRIMAFVPLIIGINVPAVQMLLGAGYDRYFFKTLVVSGFLNLTLTFTLIPRLSYIGASLSVILTEAFVTIGLYAAVQKNYTKMKSLGA